MFNGFLVDCLFLFFGLLAIIIGLKILWRDWL